MTFSNIESNHLKKYTMIDTLSLYMDTMILDPGLWTLNSLDQMYEIKDCFQDNAFRCRQLMLRNPVILEIFPILFWLKTFPFLISFEIVVEWKWKELNENCPKNPYFLLSIFNNLCFLLLFIAMRKFSSWIEKKFSFSLQKKKKKNPFYTISIYEQLIFQCK